MKNAPLGLTNPRPAACLCAAAILILLAAGQGQAQITASTDDVANEALTTLNLVAGDIVEIHPMNIAAGGLQVEVPIDGTPQTIKLTPVSVRSPNYTVLVQSEDGSYQTAPPTPERSFRGTVTGMDGSIVAGTYDENGFRGSIHLPDKKRLWVEPLAGRVTAASAVQHIVYRDEDLALVGDTCAETLLGDAQPEPRLGAVARGTGLAVAELAIDADYEYFLDYGSVPAVVGQINTIINAMNVEYERDVQIRHVIATIIVRTTASDPYTSSDSSALLSEFRTHWNNNQGAVPRDVAQLFTGRDLDQNIIGIAFLSAICTSSGYGVVESNFAGCSALACKTDLSAHELGHNWGAGHCTCTEPYPGWTMNPSITSSNRFHPQYSIPTIASFRDSRSCLGAGDELMGITITAPATTYLVGQTAQLTVVAGYRYGPDEIVTSQVTWSVDRPEFASISPTGLLTVLNAVAESCLTVNASFTDEGATKTDQAQLTVIDPTGRLSVVSSVPPQGGIDARRPTNITTGAPIGWSNFDLTLNCEPCSLSPSRFVVTQEGGTQAPPVVTSVIRISGPIMRVILNKPIEPGAWTTISDTLSDISLKVGFLPGDVNSNGAASPADILTLVDSLNGMTNLKVWSSDLDRTGAANPADIIALIDLLNGTGGNVPWNGVSLP